MKPLFACIFGLLLAWSVWAWALLPSRDVGGRSRLVWTSDDNPARQVQIKLFHAQYPEYLLTLDPANAAIEKVIVQSTAGQGPDLFDVYGVAQLQAYVNAGVALDVSDLARDSQIAAQRLWPHLRSAAVVNGRQYGFLTNVGNRLVIFNRDLFEQFGVPEPSRLLKWAEFVELAKRVTRPGNVSEQVWGLANYHWQAAIWQNGGTIFSEDGTRCTVDGAEAIEAIQWYVDLIGRHRVMPSQAQVQSVATQGGWAGTGYRGLFFAGKAAMMVDGRWMAIVMRQMNAERRQARDEGKETAAPLRYGFAPVPYQTQRATMMGARCTAINIGCPNPDEAVKFLRFLASEPYCQHINDYADGMSAVEEYATAERLKNPDYPNEHQYAQIQIEEMPFGRLDEVSPFVETTIATKIIQDHVLIAEDGLMDVAQAMQGAARLVNARIARNVQKFEALRRLYEQLTYESVAP